MWSHYKNHLFRSSNFMKQKRSTWRSVILSRTYLSINDVFDDDDNEDRKGIRIPKTKGIRLDPVSQKTKGRFISPWDQETKKSLYDVARLLFNKSTSTLKFPDNVDSKSLIKPVSVNLNKLQNISSPHVTWLGHATCYFQSDGVYFLTDPVWSSRASPLSFLGPQRFIDPPIELENLNIDVVLLSHTHYDHLDLPTARRIGNRAHWVVPLGVKSILASIGVTNVTELDWWGSYTYLQLKSGKTAHITFAPSKHWTSRSFFDRNTCLWGSFIVQSPQSKMFFSGDTAYCPSLFKTIGSYFGPFDLSAIAIGAYSPRWFMKSVHCNPDEALQIHEDIRSKQSVGIHWGTFPLTEEDPVEPALELARVRNIRGISTEQFFTMAHGETLPFGASPAFDFATVHTDYFGYYLEAMRNAEFPSTK